MWYKSTFEVYGGSQPTFNLDQFYLIQITEFDLDFDMYAVEGCLQNGEKIQLAIGSHVDCEFVLFAIHEALSKSNLLIASTTPDDLQGSRYRIPVNWASTYKAIHHADPFMVYLSFVFCRHTGFEPTGSASSWQGSMLNLWEECEENWRYFIEVLEIAESARHSGNLVFKGPSSYLTFAKNQRSLRRKNAGGIEEVM